MYESINKMNTGNRLDICYITGKKEVTQMMALVT